MEDEKQRVLFYQPLQQALISDYTMSPIKAAPVVLVASTFT
jgi:hypothetical protein